MALDISHFADPVADALRCKNCKQVPPADGVMMDAENGALYCAVCATKELRMLSLFVSLQFCLIDCQFFVFL
jgi:hypothetical protein